MELCQFPAATPQAFDTIGAHAPPLDTPSPMTGTMRTGVVPKGAVPIGICAGRRSSTEPDLETPRRMIARDGQHEIEIRKSRFICSLFRVTTEDQARAHIEAMRKQYWDATHNCTAWAIGPGLQLQRSSDDGEPSGTAGIPMLEVLRRREITDTLAVVTRYFGGIMLGAGGLIRAYGGAVSAAIDEIGVVELKPLQVLTLTASYDDAGRIENAIRASDYSLENVDYTTDVTFELVMAPDQVDPFRHWIGELTNGAIEPADAGIRHVEVPTTTEAPEPAER